MATEGILGVILDQPVQMTPEAELEAEGELQPDFRARLYAATAFLAEYGPAHGHVRNRPLVVTGESIHHLRANHVGVGVAAEADLD